MRCKRLIALVLMLLLMPCPAAEAQEPKLIALTFDDGPGAYTPRLLDILAENNAKATFFLIGSNMERYPDTVEQLYLRGHQLGNHTYNHEVLSGKDEELALAQIQKTVPLLDRVCGEGTAYAMRPPCGEYSRSLLDRMNCPAILWSVDTMDWRDKDAELVARRIMDEAYDGAIILCHDIYESTVEGIALALPKLREAGYEPVTVNELFRRRGVAVKAGGNYGKCRPTGTMLPPVEAPELRVTEGTIVLQSSQSAPIYYTLDGTMPRTGAPVYTGPLRLQPGETLCAVCAWNLNGSRSEPVYFSL